MDDGVYGMEPDTQTYGQLHFGNTDLGDKRRTKRLVQLMDKIVQNPGGTLPEKLSAPADQEAFYRLCAAEEVTHEAILSTHRELVGKKLQTTRKILLAIHDSTELDYSSRRSLKRLSQIGNGRGRGYIAQNILVVDPESHEVIGLANQLLHTREVVATDESVAEKRARSSRESRLWIAGAEGLPGRRLIVDVCDRGADTFEFLEFEGRSGRTFVIRSAHDRVVTVGHEASEAEPTDLHAYLQTLPALATTTVPARVPEKSLIQRREACQQGLRAKVETNRLAEVSLSVGQVQLHAPHVRRGNHSRELQAVWAVRIWEPHPPSDCPPLEWILLTNHPVSTADEAQLVASWYELRWIIEEFHKGLKTGCGIEKLQFRDEARLEPAIASLSVVAVSLLQLREAARRPDAKTRLAKTMVDPNFIRVLSQWSTGLPQPEWTIHEYYQALAKFGGYRRRKDSPPGWRILWRATRRLRDMVEGYCLCHKLRE